MSSFTAAGEPQAFFTLTHSRDDLGCATGPTAPAANTSSCYHAEVQAVAKPKLPQAGVGEVAGACASPVSSTYAAFPYVPLLTSSPAAFRALHAQHRARPLCDTDASCGEGTPSQAASTPCHRRHHRHASSRELGAAGGGRSIAPRQGHGQGCVPAVPRATTSRQDACRDVGATAVASQATAAYGGAASAEGSGTALRLCC